MLPSIFLAVLPVLAAARVFAVEPQEEAPAPVSSGTPAAQDSTPSGDVLERAAPEARAMWERLVAACGPANREPIRAFELKADVLTRTGVQSNEARIDYRYLAPDCIRFMLPSRGETGRFGTKPEQYWLKSGDEVIVLAGREYKEDRLRVDEMVALARNYVALSSPARISIQALERMPAAPSDLGPALASATKKLTWLAIESPDFALLRGDAPRPPGTVYRVEIGQREDGLPAVAIVRERASERAQGDPLLVQFSKYEERDEFRIPLVLKVHVLDRTRSPLAFAERASQEVYVTSASLRPALKVEDFQPGVGKK